MLRLILSNFKRTFTDITFYFCILLVFMLCFTATAAFDPKTTDPITVLDLIIRNDSQLVRSDITLNAYGIFKTGGTGEWLVMFLPIVVGFSFVKRFCDGRDSRFIRFETVRLSKTGYAAGTLISAVLLGGLAVTVGYALYGIYTAAVFPDLAYYPDLAQSYLDGAVSELVPPFDGLYSVIGMPALYIAKLAGMFLYGAAAALPAAVCASLMRNQYLIICLPFFANYLMTVICQRLWGLAFASDDSPYWISDVASVIYPSALADIFTYKSIALPTAAYSAVLIAAAFVLFITVMNRRFDKGE